MVDALGVGQQEQKPHRTVGIVAEGLNYSQAVFWHGCQWRNVGATRETCRAALLFYSLFDLPDIGYLLMGLTSENLRMTIMTFT